jgi:hypothetical protein
MLAQATEARNTGWPVVAVDAEIATAGAQQKISAMQAEYGGRPSATKPKELAKTEPTR